MSNKILITASEISDELGVSKSFAYKLIQQLNDLLKEQGYLTVSGKVSRQYYKEKMHISEIVKGA